VHPGAAGSAGDKPGSANDKSGSAGNKCGSADDKFGSTDNKSGSADNKSGSTDDKSGSADDKSGSTDAQPGSTWERQQRRSGVSNGSGLPRCGPGWESDRMVQSGLLGGKQGTHRVPSYGSYNFVSN